MQPCWTLSFDTSFTRAALQDLLPLRREPSEARNALPMGTHAHLLQALENQDESRLHQVLRAHERRLKTMQASDPRECSLDPQLDETRQSGTLHEHALYFAGLARDIQCLLSSPWLQASPRLALCRARLQAMQKALRPIAEWLLTASHQTPNRDRHHAAILALALRGVGEILGESAAIRQSHAFALDATPLPFATALGHPEFHGTHDWESVEDHQPQIHALVS